MTCFLWIKLYTPFGTPPFSLSVDVPLLNQCLYSLSIGEASWQPSTTRSVPIVIAGGELTLLPVPMNRNTFDKLFCHALSN